MSIFRDIGEALYGAGGSPAWHARLGDEIGVNSRTVRRWEAGTQEPPPDVYRELLGLVERREAKIGDVAYKLDRIVHAEA